MINADNCFIEAINSPVRKLRARVELYEGSTLLKLLCCGDNLKSFSIERVGEDTKFFGYGICQRLNVKILDPHRELDITTANTLEIEFGTECNYVYPSPVFRVSRVIRDENTNELSITAYDGLYEATKHTVSELDIEAPFTLRLYAAKCAQILGFPLAVIGAESSFDEEYSIANYNGTETIREALNAIAEATQTIYYIDSQWNLTFRRLDRDGEPVYNIDREHYYTLDSGENRRLAKICHATELGDNIEAALEVSGTTQYIRNNPYWELDDSVAAKVDAALAAVGGLTINQFECSWRGNFLLEIGDKIALTTKDDKTVISYLLDDVLEYDGSLLEKTQWKFATSDSETAANPTSLGEAIRNTYAKVDKANQEIEMAVKRIDGNASDISYLKLNADSIAAEVLKTQENIDAANGDIETLTNKVNASLTAEQVKIEVQKELANGVNKVQTSTGFTFDSEGLTVSKTGSEMTTQITEDGMTVSRDNTALLTANNEGVVATNLHANTYLWIGTNSRLEDYQSTRTGCFWVG